MDAPPIPEIEGLETDHAPIPIHGENDAESSSEDEREDSESSTKWSYNTVKESSLAHAVIIGAGPGGAGPLIRAAKTGKLTELLKKGVVWIDSRAIECFGGGALGSYTINSNTSASVFMKMLVRDNDPKAHSALKALRKEYVAVRDLEVYGDDIITPNP